MSLIGSTLAYFEDYNMLQELNRWTFHSEIARYADVKWLVTVCHSGHWECKAYMSYYYRQNLMFPLSEEDQMQLGYIDTADYSEIESAMKADIKMPRIVMITEGGKNLYIYEGDAENLEGIQRFVREEYKKQEPLRIPKNSELINYSGFS